MAAAGAMNRGQGCGLTAAGAMNRGQGCGLTAAGAMKRGPTGPAPGPSFCDSL
jgi:hypothetical protein